MKLVYSAEAEQCIARENAAWSAYADHPLLFEEEFDATIAAIQKNPDRPVYEMTRRGPVPRVMPAGIGVERGRATRQWHQTVTWGSIRGAR